MFYFHPYLGKIPILTNIFQMGWNHQPVYGFHVGKYTIVPWIQFFMKKHTRYDTYDLFQPIVWSVLDGHVLVKMGVELLNQK